ncbi:FtsK/SpoIIIE family DNA translocase [Parablautia sp. Marseille-Q6255]|uniref:FtsK/SpoIIIE family DNA translocase n=1 Tax=Parablautia sp. Marseille-Q6255 TaxID=3039593 RepID=UPI0024BC110A|nr:DNA translocase FtsK [Parablautia sp. Marseille-Q6255]
MASNATKKKTTTAKKGTATAKGGAAGKSTGTGKSSTAAKKSTGTRKSGTAVKQTAASVREAGPSKSTGKTAKRTRSGESRPAKLTRVEQQTAGISPDREQTNPLIVREAVLWLILAVCILLYISYFGIGGYLGEVISDVSFGVFGITAYAFPVIVFVAAAFLISNRGSRIASVKCLSALGLYICICGVAALFVYGEEPHATAAQLYEFCASKKTGGGVIGGTICSLLQPALGVAGTGILLLVLMIVFFVLTTQKSLMRFVRNKSSRVYRSARESSARRREAHRREMEEWQEEEAYRRHHPVVVRDNVRNAQAPGEDRADETACQEQPQQNVMAQEKGHRGGRQQVRTEIDVPVLFPVQGRESRTGHKVCGVTMDTKIVGSPESVGAEIHEIMPGHLDGGRSMRMDASPEKGTSYIDLEQLTADMQTDEKADDMGLELYSERMPLHIEGIHTQQQEEAGGGQEELPYREPHAVQPSQEAQAAEQVRKAPESREKVSEVSEEDRKEQEEAARPMAPKKNPRSSKEEIEEGIASVQAEMEKAAEAVKPEYVFPPLDLLKRGSSKSSAGQEQEIRKTAAKLQQTLESFGVRVTVTNVSCGPSVTRYELLPEQGVKVSRIVSLADDIKLNLAAADIRIEAPIPGKAAVGIEVPNTENSAVALRDLLESKEFRKHPSKLAFATGKDIAGKVVVSDIAKMPHLLIAGATGSGKSVCINTLIMSILYKAKPEEVKLIMIDPKVVELSVYNGIPHLYIPVVTDPKKAAGALNWGVAEMTDRYNKFAELGVRDLKGYNKKIEDIQDIEDDKKPQKLPQIIIIVDELADLMMVAPGEVEDSICRLAQLARAAGIHLIIATQRPSVNVITGLIKANMPSRIAFSVTSSVDSRTIIDMGGAEKLLGKGDMLFYPQGYQKPARVQGAFVSDEEVSDVVDFLKNKNTDPSYRADIEAQIAKVQHSAAAARGEEDTDALFADAGKFIIEKDKASIGMLQRVFKIGFNRAARIMDQLSEAGVVGPEEGTKPRKILMSAEEFENYLEEN